MKTNEVFIHSTPLPLIHHTQITYFDQHTPKPTHNPHSTNIMI